MIATIPAPDYTRTTREKPPQMSASDRRPFVERAKRVLTVIEWRIEDLDAQLARHDKEDIPRGVALRADLAEAHTERMLARAWIIHDNARREAGR